MRIQLSQPVFGEPELSDVVSKPAFYVSRAVKATRKQFLKAYLGRGASHRGEKCVPLGRDLRVGRQTVQVDQALCLCDCVLVEGRNSRGKRVNKPVEFSGWQRAIDVAISLRQLAADVVGS